MRGRTIVIMLAGAAFLASWLVPVIEDGATLADGILPGWQAFRLAMAPVWSYGILDGGDGLWDVVSVASALTNVAFVLAFAVLALSRPGARRPVVAAAVAVAAALNTIWPLMAESRSDLLAGYWLWLAAFVLLATSAAVRPGASRRVATTPSPAA